MSRRAFAECVFCGKEAPLTKEHVWPKWLQTVMLPNRKLPHRHTTTIAGVREERRPAPPFSMQLEAVCASCNNNWMASMEGTAKPILIPMIAGRRCSLSVEEQRVVARWVAKTAMVFQLTTHHNSIRPHHYRYLKNQLVPPTGNQVWLAARTNEEPVPSAFGIRTSDLRNSADDREFHGYLVTIVIGHFIAQLYGHDLPFDSEWSRHGEFDEALVSIYPERESMSWPPPQILRSFVSLAEDPAFEEEMSRGFRARGQQVLFPASPGGAPRPRPSPYY